MKISIRIAKPRNPLVALSRMRRAGRHERSSSAQRQQGRTALREELERIKPNP